MELENELEDLENPLPKWAFLQDEWNQMMGNRVRLRKLIANVKKELSNLPL